MMFSQLIKNLFYCLSSPRGLGFDLAVGSFLQFVFGQIAFFGAYYMWIEAELCALLATIHAFLLDLQIMWNGRMKVCRITWAFGLRGRERLIEANRRRQLSVVSRARPIRDRGGYFGRRVAGEGTKHEIRNLTSPVSNATNRANSCQVADFT